MTAGGPAAPGAAEQGKKAFLGDAPRKAFSAAPPESLFCCPACFLGGAKVS